MTASVIQQVTIKHNQNRPFPVQNGNSSFQNGKIIISIKYFIYIYTYNNFSILN